MAGNLKRETLQVDVVINGNKAQAELYKIEQRQRELNNSNKALRAEKAKLIAQGKKETAAYKEVTAAISKNNAELKSNKLQMSALQKQIGITGLSMRQLKARASELRLSLNNMVPGSGKYKQLNAELQQVNTQIKKLSVNARASESSLSKVANGFNKFAALGASVIAMGTGIVLSLQKMIDYNGKLSDAQSNVQKTTGLTKVEVDELTKSFGLLKTRTARIELLQLAEEAGRLGIEGTKNVRDFVEVANQIKVALGDDLGDEQIREVGKMVNVYKVGEKTGRDFKNSLLSLGSAINEVSASGANQAGFLVDFIKRTGGISDVANISAQDMLGLAAAFDEVGQSQEISATAINKFFGSAAEDVKSFARVAGVSIEEYSRLLREDANGALLLFLKGLKQGNPSLEEMAVRLKGIELGGTRGAQAISALATDVENLEEKQRIANKSLIEATSLTAEYDLKNNNLAGSIDKIKKSLLGAFSSEVVVEGLTNFVEWFAVFIGASEDADGKITVFRNRLIAFLKTIIIVTAAIISYKTAVQLAALWTNTLDQTSKLYIITQKIQTAITTGLRAATLLLSAGYNLVTGNIVRARAAMVLFNRTMMLNPIGLVVGAITAAVVAYAVFSENSKKAATSQSLLNDALGEATKNTAAIIKSKELLLDIARDETQSLEARQKAVDELNRTVPEYNNQLTIEAANTDKAKQSLDKHIESLKQAAVAHVLMERIKAKAVELADIENSSLEDNIEWYEKLWISVKNGGAAYGSTLDAGMKALQNKKDNATATQAEIDLLEELYKKQTQGAGWSFVGTITGGGVTPDPEKPDPFVPLKTPKTKSGNDAAKRARELLQLQRATEDAKLEIMADGFEKQMLLEDFNHYRKIEDLQDKLVSQELIAKTGDANLRASYIENNKNINSQIESENELHALRKGSIIEKGYGEDIKKSQEAYEREKVVRETAFLEELNGLQSLAEAKALLKDTLSSKELAQIKTLDDAKKALRDQFAQEELDKEKERLDELVAMLVEFKNSGAFDGFDLNLMTAEQQAEFTAQIDALKLKLQELKAAKDGVSGKSTEGEEGVPGIAGVGDAANVDILGFSAQDWADMIANISEYGLSLDSAAQMVQGLMNAWATYHEFVSAKENREFRKFEQNTNKKKSKQKDLLDSGMINRRQYDAAIQALDQEADKKKAELEYKQAKRAWQMQLTQAIVGTAQAVLNGLATTPFFPLGIAMGALAGILGGVQIATIAKNKPVKGYEKGLYPVTREQDGKQFNAAYGGPSRSGLVDEPTVFLAGERGKASPELIINGEDLKQFHPDLRNSLYREIGRVKGYENGLYQNQTNSPDFDNTTSSSSNAAFMATMAETNALLRDLRDNPIIAMFSDDYKAAVRLQKQLDKAKKLKDKSRI